MKVPAARLLNKSSNILLDPSTNIPIMIPIGVMREKTKIKPIIKLSRSGKAF